MFYCWLIEANTQLNARAELLLLIGIVFIITIGVVLLNQHFQKNLFRQKLEKEEIRNLHQQELLRSSILAQERERKRIAQDIHDELGALLSISRMHIVHLEEKGLDPAKMPAALQNIRSLIEKSLSSMRKISHELMPPQLESFGLIKTLEAVATHANNTGSIDIHIETTEPFPQLNWPIKLGLYRICMELINNTLKHAKADTIIIQLKQTDNCIECIYTDNGKQYTGKEMQIGLGVKSMEGRAYSLGGSILFHKSDEGFRAEVLIPLTK